MSTRLGLDVDFALHSTLDGLGDLVGRVGPDNGHRRDFNSQVVGLHP